MPTYGVEQGDLLQELASGPKPGQGWLSLMRLHDCLMMQLEAEVASPNGKQLLSTLSRCAAQCEELGIDLTDDEKRAGGLYKAIAQTIDRTFADTVVNGIGPYQKSRIT